MNRFAENPGWLSECSPSCGASNLASCDALDHTALVWEGAASFGWFDASNWVERYGLSVPLLLASQTSLRERASACSRTAGGFRREP